MVRHNSSGSLLWAAAVSSGAAWRMTWLSLAARIGWAALSDASSFLPSSTFIFQVLRALSRSPRLFVPDVEAVSES
jgi:hypothetical protein